MPRVDLETKINAPVKSCFDLMRDVRVQPSIFSTADAFGLGQTVTFHGRFLGLKQDLMVKVIEFDSPHRFVDMMIRGPFRSFVHIHEYRQAGHGTLMHDTVLWESIFGIPGILADKFFLGRYFRNSIRDRNLRLKKLAEESSG